MMSALLLVLLLVVAAFHHSGHSGADPPNPALQFQWGGVQIRAAAVDPQIIHLVVGPVGGSSVPSSPFVVEREKPAVMAASPPGQASVLQIQSLRFVRYPTGALELKAGPDQTLISRGSIRSAGGSIVFSFQHHPGERLYGGGNAGMDRSGGLIHNAGVSGVANGVSRPAFLWSTGGWAVFIATNESGISWLDDGSRQTWTVPGSTADIYLLTAPGPYQLLQAYTRLTGRAPLPPRWTFGYLQSRWGYSDEPDVQQKWAEFRRLQIPVDAFIYDYDWFVNDWDFNPKTFPDPAADLSKMHALGLHFVGIRKPRVYDAHFDEAQKNGWILTGHDVSFDLPAVRSWWWSHQEPLVKDGVDGWWNDEAEQKYDEFFFMALSEWEGAKKMDPSPERKRVWSLNRAFTPGMQRLGAAVWTGDIQSSWDSLENQPGTLLSYGLCGMSFCGQDIGGFNGTPDAELYTRWIQEGVFVPVMRAHGNQNSDRWPRVSP
ncbi:MAG: glycoside hydrolase family 31 protein [Chloroflexi bacterium]|nr:glycoside hydrolase family 31 protein [Chloroflexota bacterium]